jgi:hypothetical protein
MTSTSAISRNSQSQSGVQALQGLASNSDHGVQLARNRNGNGGGLGGDTDLIVGSGLDSDNSDLEVDGVPVNSTQFPGGPGDFSRTGLRTTEEGDHEIYDGNPGGPQVLNRNDDELNSTDPRFATIANLVGREWKVRLLQEDGVTPLEELPTREQWLNQHLQEKRREFLQENGFPDTTPTDVNSIPANVLREADRIAFTPHSLIEIVGDELEEGAQTQNNSNSTPDIKATSLGSAGTTSQEDLNQCFVQPGKRYVMAVGVRMKIREAVANAGDAGFTVAKCVEQLKELTSVDEVLEFFWQESDAMLEVAVAEERARGVDIESMIGVDMSGNPLTWIYFRALYGKLVLDICKSGFKFYKRRCTYNVHSTESIIYMYFVCST